MKKYMVSIFLIGSVQAAEVEFSFFDNPITQAEKFEKACIVGQVVDSIKINGRFINLPKGNWRVVGAYSNESKIKMQGGGTDIQTTDGTLFLASEEAGSLTKTFWLNSDLQSPRGRTWRSGDPESCLPKNYWLYQKVNDTSDKKRSCFAIKKRKLDLSNNAERLDLIKNNFERAYGVKFPEDGAKIYRSSIVQTFDSAKMEIIITDTYAEKDIDEEVSLIRPTWESAEKYW
jgi:hypothetical protein